TTSVREDRRIGAEKTEQLAEQQRRRDPRDAGKRRMREDRHSAVAGECGETCGATHHRGDEERVHAGVTRFVKFLPYLPVITGQTRRKRGTSAGVAIGIVHGALHRAYAVGERRR